MVSKNAEGVSHAATVPAVRAALESAFGELDAHFDRPAGLLAFRPMAGWSAPQVLEHVALTNHFLMLTLAKHAATALRRAARGETPAASESDLAALDIIGERGSFDWVRPDHMEPTGAPSLGEVRATLAAQLAECLATLDRLSGGAGALVAVTMTVAGLGKLDLYQWLMFLAQHARRHLSQLGAIEAEWRASSAAVL